MKKPLSLLHLVRAVVLVSAISVVPASAATIINFDDISTGALILQMPTGYGGIDWLSTEFGVYSASDSPYNAQSSPNRVLANRVTLGSAPEEIQFSFQGGPVVFNGAYFAGDGSTDVQFFMYLSGSPVGSSGVLTPSGTPTFLSSGYSGLVDTVGIVGTRGFYVFDDVSFDAAATPEPATGVLMLSALAVAGLYRFRRTRRTI